MFAVDDTIVAIATPAGRGAIGVVRLSGTRAMEIADRLIGRARPLSPRRATFATLAPSLASGATAAAGDATDVTPADGRAREDRGAAAIRDQVIVTYFPAPASATGQDVIEVSTHGSGVVLRHVVQTAIAYGARLAAPGEFTLRAFLAGKTDLVRAEAVADLVDAVTPLQARTACDQLEGTLSGQVQAIEAELFDLVARLEASLDFAEEGYHFVDRAGASAVLERTLATITHILRSAARGRLIREGAQVVIAGPANAGKSSLFNGLLNTERAIVTALPGTTRDLLTERLDLGGIAVTLVDTAGVRDSTDPIEQQGIERARSSAAVADVIVLVLDRSQALSEDARELLRLTAGQPRVVVANKSDLAAAWGEREIAAHVVSVAATTGVGLQALVRAVVRVLTGAEEARDTPSISNLRQIGLLEDVREQLTAAARALEQTSPPVAEEFVLTHLHEAATRLQELTGRRVSEDVLAHIFSRFCIGK